MGDIGRRAGVLAAVVLTSAALTGCGLLGGGGRGEPGWVHDEDARRYYRPGVLLQSAELVDEHFPALGEPARVSLAEGRFTDPDERIPLPAPDDYWWQAVLELAPEDARELATASASAGASDAGGAPDSGGGTLEPVDEAEVLALLVPSLEEELAACEGGWASVLPALARGDGGDITVAGDLIEIAALCEDSGILVTSAVDM